MVYEAAEDSFLLKRNISAHASGRVLDMGTGSGILANEAKKYADEVVAADIDGEAIEQCKINIEGINFVKSDLFENIHGKFDLIIFNPPYLPDDKGCRETSLHGGKKGYETIEKFINSIDKHMKKECRILMLFSSLTKKEKVDEIIRKKCLIFKEIDRESLFFEKLYVYLIEKSPLLKELESKGINDIKYFTSGKRGVLYEGIYKKNKVIIKSKNPLSQASGKMRNEAIMLKKLNKHEIGPKIISSGEEYIIYYFIEGVMFPHYIRKNTYKNIRNVLGKLFTQLKILDELGVNKEEMHKPNKHILINEKTRDVVMIDFERATFTLKPHNITQFITYLTSGPIFSILLDKGFNLERKKLLQMAKDYRQGSIEAEDIKNYIENEI